ncbi:sensor histidine kinase [bacterium]|nr:sensor histidine kinase [bacterium]
MLRDKENKKLLLFHSIILLLLIFSLITLKIELNIILLVTIFYLITIIITWYHLYKKNKKIKNLSTYMNNILNNNYSLDIRDYEEGNLSNLKNDIYKMTVKLKEQSDLSQKEKKYLEEVLSDISHQLKTPLTSMYVINDVLLSDKKIDDSKKQEFLIKNRKELERIEWLVTSLLKMSRLDSGSEKIILKETKIDDLIRKTVTPLEIPIELKNQHLILDYDKNIKLNIDLNWTTEALINILKNAHEHTKENGTIQIKVKDTVIYTEIEIIDTGEGISTTDLPHIFERFYKGKTNKESIGIGLNMAKKIINLEKGDIKVISNSNGTTFNIKFYKQII